jgi:hypothetical protein
MEYIGGSTTTVLINLPVLQAHCITTSMVKCIAVSKVSDNVEPFSTQNASSLLSSVEGDHSSRHVLAAFRKMVLLIWWNAATQIPEAVNCHQSRCIDKCDSSRSVLRNFDFSNGHGLQPCRYAS